jgi:hypothetical protein
MALHPSWREPRAGRSASSDLKRRRAVSIKIVGFQNTLYAACVRDVGNSGDFSVDAFARLIAEFLETGYRFCSFGVFEPERCVLLRHDVDFSPRDAARMALIERELGISATYFILLTSAFYNPMAPRTKAHVAEIVANGARLGLHFDPSIYDNYEDGFERERRIFEECFGEKLEFVSLHRPRDFLDDNNRRLPGVRHTYEDAFFKDLKYFADSGGSFAHGHPLDSAEFQQRKSVHLNLHPIWWMRDGVGPSDKLRSWERSHFHAINDEVGLNCKTFDGRPVRE